VIVRNATTSDAAIIATIYGPIVAETTISFEEVPPTAEEMQQRIAAASKHYPYLVAERDGKVVGYAYASEHRSRAAYRLSVDVTVYIAESARRSSVGTKLYNELLRQLSERGFHAAFAGIALPNPGSVGLHEAMGFQHVGTYREVGFKFGRWLDVGWWQRLIDP
jgi:L-amino acid N-acyltransferase YncA